jgi:hypothetical protein
MSLPGYSGQRPHTDLVRRQVHRRRLQLDVHFLDLPEATQPDNTHPGVLLPPAIDCQLADPILPMSSATEMPVSAECSAQAIYSALGRPIFTAILSL